MIRVCKADVYYILKGTKDGRVVRPPDFQNTWNVRTRCRVDQLFGWSVILVFVVLERGGGEF